MSALDDIFNAVANVGGGFVKTASNAFKTGGPGTTSTQQSGGVPTSQQSGGAGSDGTQRLSSGGALPLTVSNTNSIMGPGSSAPSGGGGQRGTTSSAGGFNQPGYASFGTTDAVTDPNAGGYGSNISIDPTQALGTTPSVLPTGGPSLPSSVTAAANPSSASNIIQQIIKATSPGATGSANMFGQVDPNMIAAAG